MIQVLPQPRKEPFQFQRDFIAGIAKLAPNTKPNYTMLEGFVAGRVLLEGLKRAGGNINRAQLTNALDSLSDIDLGGYRIRFSKDNHDGSRFVDLGVVDNTGQLRF